MYKLLFRIIPLKDALSHIGMIIHSTTLDTEAKVKAIYGSNTSWISHSSYVLRGATSGVVANNATKTGGNDNAIVPYHNHTVNGGSHTHGIGFANATGSGSYISWAPNRTRIDMTTDWDGGHTHNCTYAGTSGNTINANIPNYKSVYIWERIA